jgi:hypothetical protein
LVEAIAHVIAGVDDELLALVPLPVRELRIVVRVDRGERLYRGAQTASRGRDAAISRARSMSTPTMTSAIGSPDVRRRFEDAVRRSDL